ncbi:MAG: methyltransferase domain-containing protein [Clostridiales bacterium]|nr:methyltransferase domain-containing protein [Clostridiales bacterium]
MDYIGNINYWDTKFKSRGESLLEPDTELIDNVDILSKGSVLDIACGDGRNSLFLLKKGFNVTGVDFSSEALDRLNHFVKLYKHEISTVKVNLNSENSLDSIGCFDNIIINHYRLPVHQMKSISNRLKKDGILFITGFGHKHIPDEKIKDGDLIRESDFEYLNHKMKLIHYNEYSDARGFFVTYIYKKL